MSARDDRIPVPSNGNRPPDAALLEGAPPADTPAAVVDDDLRDPPRIIVTPGQATAVGFGIIAGLILLLLGRRRGRRG